MNRIVGRGLAAAAVSAIIFGLGAGAAQATGSYSLDLYISPPFVQGSTVYDAGTRWEDFNDFNRFQPGSNACNGSWGIGTATGDCNVNSLDGAGGATQAAVDGSPTVGGAGSNYACTQWTPGTVFSSIDVTLTSPVKYIGFWWSAGNRSNGVSYTNMVEFYSGSTLVAKMTADDVMDIVGTQPAPFPGSATLTSNDSGSTYTAGYYYGHPHAQSSVTPTNASPVTPDAPFLYLNLFVSGDASVDRMVISGDGFEFDNVVTSTNAQTVSGNLVFAKNITLTEPTPTPTDPPVDPGTSSADGSGLPDTGLVFATFIGIALVGAFLFFAAGGAFSSKTRLRHLGVDLEVKNQLDQIASSFERMDRLRRRRRR